MRLHLGGHLDWYDAQKRAWLEIDLPAPIPLVALLEQIGAPPGDVAIASVNGRLVRLESAVVSDGDTVALYPAIGGGAGFMPAPPNSTT